MKLYLISQNVNNDYDTYDGFVVCAENEDEARSIHPLDGSESNYGSWVKKAAHIKVKYLGEAKKGMKAGEILSSFNAG